METALLNPDLLDEARAIESRIVDLRRRIHAEPELGLHTPQTIAKVRAELADLPLQWRDGPSCSGAVAVLKGKQPGPRVLLRGDMDALPMQEHTGLSFASATPGRMHACGHDAHTAMLAGAARLLAQRRETISGEVLFMFQPGEEGFHGARHMLEDGLLGGAEYGPVDYGPLPDAAFALHVWPNARHGAVIGRAGAMLASADQLEITVRGAGGHASMPFDATDPVPVAAEIVLALQSMMTRRFDAGEAAVLSITKIAAGSAHNIIPDTVDMLGTIRTLSAQRRSALHQAINQVAEHVAMAHGCAAQVAIIDGFPVTINDPRAIELARAVATGLAGEDGFEDRPNPSMGAEDFSYVLEQVPGAMLFLGAAAQGGDWQGCCGLHSSRMVIDESVMPQGAAFLAGCALRFGERGWA